MRSKQTEPESSGISLEQLNIVRKIIPELALPKANDYLP